jgi:hypothetical protein
MLAPFEHAQDDVNPLDMVEELSRAKRWAYTRHDDGLMTILVKGQKDEFEICLEWQDEFCALLVACSMPLEIKDEHYEMAAQTLEQINQNMWMGHFDLSNKGVFPTFRYTLLCRLLPAGVVTDVVHDIFEIAMAECNRFYTTFQLIQAGDVRLRDNLHAAVFETIGEA